MVKYVNFETDTDKLNIVVYRYRNNLYLKDDEFDLKLTEYQSLTRDLKFHLNTIVFAKTYRQVHVSVGILDFLYVRWTKNLKLVEPLVMGTRTWSSHFVISKSLDYTQYYMFLLQQCDNIVAEVETTVT